METREKVQALLEQLFSRRINRTQARQELLSLGIAYPLADKATTLFCSGEASYDDAFRILGA